MSFQEIDLHALDNQVLGGSYLTQPLAANMDVFFQLTMLLLFLVAATVSLRIFIRWQNGEETEVIPVISRWFFGIILAFCLITFLKIYVENQTFGDHKPVISEKPELNLNPIN